MKLIMNQIQKIYIDSNKFKIKLDNKPIKNDIYYENTENKKKQANILKQEIKKIITKIYINFYFQQKTQNILLILMNLKSVGNQSNILKI